MKRWSVVASVLALVLVTGPAVAQEALRPEVGKPLQEASDLIKAT